MAEEGEDVLCLSGRRPKMMSRKTEPPREKKSSLMETVPRKERPKTAVRKLAQLKTPLSRSSTRPRSAAVTPIPGSQQTNSRPMSARLPLKPVVGRGRVLRSIGSIDSGLSPHHSSPDQSSDDETADSEESRGHDTTEEDEEESVDSGIIKVKISKYDDADEERACDFTEREVDATTEESISNKEVSANFEDETKPSKVIFVKEAEVEDENESETETLEDEMLDDEMDAGNGEIVFTGHQKTISPPSDKDEPDNGFDKESIKTQSTVSPDMVLTDVEPHELCGILARQERRDDTGSAGQRAESQRKEDVKTEERPSYEKRMEDVMSRLELEEKKTYDLAVYKTTKELEDTGTDNNVATKDETSYDLTMYNREEDIKEKLPVNNVTKDKEQLMYDVSTYQSKGMTNSAKNEEDARSKEKEEEAKDYTSLADEELAELKRKCLARVEKHKTTPIVSNPPVIKDFSNSQKLINFLDKTEEKDRNTINNVKRSNYTAQVTLPFLTPMC